MVGQGPIALAVGAGGGCLDIFFSFIYLCLFSFSLSGVAIWLKSQKSRVRYPVRPHTVVFPSADSRRAVVNYWQKYVHEVLVNRLGGLSLPIRLTDRPDMTLDVYR